MAKKAEKEKKEKVEKTKEQKAVNGYTVKVEATHYMMEELKKANDTLKLISNKLAFIVDELTK